MATTYDQLRELLLRQLQLLTTHITAMHATVESLPQTANGKVHLLSTRGTLLDQSNKLLSSLSALLGRAEANEVAIMVSGLLKTGKSSTVNALVGALCCPMADNANTSGVLTIDVDAGRKDYLLSTNNGAHGRVLVRGTALAVHERLRAINATLRACEPSRQRGVRSAAPRAFAHGGRSNATRGGLARRE